MRIANVTSSTAAVSRRPRSLTIVAVLQIIQSLVLLGLGAYLLYTIGWAPVAPEQALPFLPLALYGPLLSRLALLALGAAGLVSALALLQVKPWAWLAAMLLQGAGLAAALAGYINKTPNYIGMFLGVVIVFYLTQQEVQSAFRERPSESDRRSQEERGDE